MTMCSCISWYPLCSPFGAQQDANWLELPNYNALAGNALKDVRVRLGSCVSGCPGSSSHTQTVIGSTTMIAVPISAWRRSFSSTCGTGLLQYSRWRLRSGISHLSWRYFVSDGAAAPLRPCVAAISRVLCRRNNDGSRMAEPNPGERAFRFSLWPGRLAANDSGWWFNNDLHLCPHSPKQEASCRTRQIAPVPARRRPSRQDSTRHQADRHSERAAACAATEPLAPTKSSRHLIVTSHALAAMRWCDGYRTGRVRLPADIVHEPEVEPPLSYEVHALLDAGAIIAARR
jgi:hypothetical protein